MSVVVVFYSRYNTQSLEFLNDIEKLMDVRKLCVDEKNVRETIMNEDVNYNIRLVPSLLIFHSNGFLEKHDGFQKCNEWLVSVTPSEPIPVEEVKPIQKHVEKVAVDDIEFDPIRVDAKPLFDMKPDKLKNDQNAGNKLKEDQESQIQHTIKKNNSSDSILNLAQQMQKQRDSDVNE